MLARRIIPCLDVKDGRVVKGTNFEGLRDMADPVEMARFYNESGADELVYYDITASAEGRNLFTDILRRVASEVFIPLTVGGGIRTYEQIEGLLSLGVSQVILGSAAIYDPQLVERANRDFPHKIVVGIDAKNGYAAADGWEKDSNLTAEALARRVAAAGTERIIFTDISRDGMMNGSNIEATAALYQACGVPITASGGVSSLEDIRRLKAREIDGIEGCIIVKALYAGAFTHSEALKKASEV